MTVKEFKPSPTIYIDFVLLPTEVPCRSNTSRICNKREIPLMNVINHKFVITLREIATKQ